MAVTTGRGLEPLLGAESPGAPPAGDERDPSAGEPTELILALGKALHAAGSASPRIEEGMATIARRLGIEAHFFSTPTALFASFRDERGRRTMLERVEPADVNLERLVLLDRLMGEMAAGTVPPREAARRLASIATLPSRFGPAVTAMSFALVSLMAAYFFGGGPSELLAATAIGLVPGVLSAVAARRPLLTRLFDPLAAVLVAFLATAWATAFGGVSAFLVTLSGLIVLVPGLTLTVSLSELAHRHLVAGSARFAGGVTVLFALALGVALGREAGAAVFGEPPIWTSTPLSASWRWLAVLVAAAAFTVLFRARPRDLPWLVVAGVVAVEGLRAGNHLLGPQLGAFAGSFLVGIAGNVFARLRHQPSALITMPGLILLVPGSLGFRSLAALLEQDVLAGVQTAFATTLVAIALATGLLLANLVFPPRRIL